MRRLLLRLTCCLLSCVGSALTAAELTEPVDVAPQASETRHQTWASAAWCESARCWLVAWREGYLNENVTDIWCGRISAEGKALDPKGIRLTNGGALNGRPRVASDGKSFLVVWDTLRNSSGSGKVSETDWDVLAIRVDADGKPDRDTLKLADGKHNQCRPDITFAKENYFVAWMEYENGAYGIQGLRVAPSGKKVDTKPAVIARFDLKNLGNFATASQALLPVLASNQNGDLLSAFHADSMHYYRYVGRRPINATTGQPLGSPLAPRPEEKVVPGAGTGPYGGAAIALALGTDNGLLVGRARGEPPQKDVIVYQLSKTGDVLGSQELGSSVSLGATNAFLPRPGVSFAGKSYLVVTDGLCAVGGDSNRNIRPTLYTRVMGWKLESDGKVEDAKGFVIAGSEKRECLLPAVAAGPQGTWLVVYSENRGIDDMKLVGRLVK
ncbi:MAG: hypothetical protein RMJ52_16270 [Gemmataceae bacterium]|nr:hypothetical protein [Gemmatales bacterium]MDW8266877.1 hypothetical protein [Gemmataceae bacterium]